MKTKIVDTNSQLLHCALGLVGVDWEAKMMGVRKLVHVASSISERDTQAAQNLVRLVIDNSPRRGQPIAKNPGTDVFRRGEVQAISLVLDFPSLLVGHSQDERVLPWASAGGARRGSTMLR